MIGSLKRKLLYWWIEKEAKKMLEKTPKSWRTTLAGVGALLVVIGDAVRAVFDGDPATNVNWAVTVPAIITGLGLLFARDQKAHEEGSK